MVKYIDNKKFEKLIYDYRRNKRKYEEELVSNLKLLISNIIDGFHFKVEKEDAIQECYVLVLKVLKNFKPEKGKIFNYLTTVIMNNLRLIYSKNKRYNEKIDCYIEHRYGLHPSSMTF